MAMTRLGRIRLWCGCAIFVGGLVLIVVFRLMDLTLLALIGVVLSLVGMATAYQAYRDDHRRPRGGGQGRS
ncbi:hypothetical protein [Isoptericola sp. NPDC056605]|uniref:hypothetical protein n=1 Tax=Isoptericola sp. NPDC056605 TaxID=3345876 RepID=UPI0036752AD1